MSHKQVITITVEGTMQGLQVKPGQGLDLRQFGDCKVVRASEIAWSEADQAWFVDVLQEVGRGPITFTSFGEAMAEPDNHVPTEEELDSLVQDGRWWKRSDDDDTLLFEEYTDAVGAEVMYLNALRAKGLY